jgi:hypothetical protein
VLPSCYYRNVRLAVGQVLDSDVHDNSVPTQI